MTWILTDEVLSETEDIIAKCMNITIIVKLVQSYGPKVNKAVKFNSDSDIIYGFSDLIQGVPKKCEQVWKTIAPLYSQINRQTFSHWMGKALT